MQIGIVIRHVERQHLRPAFLKQCKVLFSFCIQHNYQRTLCTLKKKRGFIKTRDSFTWDQGTKAGHHDAGSLELEHLSFSHLIFSALG